MRTSVTRSMVVDNQASSLDTLNVEDYGANGKDNMEDSESFQRAIDDAAMKGKVLFVPSGIFLIKDVNLRSNSTIVGEGKASVLKKIFDGEFALGCNFSYLKPRSDPHGIYNVKNINIFKLHFIGTSTTDGFSQYKHLVNLNGVEQVNIKECSFTAFNGDGIYLGSDVGVERHNKNIIISNCFFNGINKENRNGISVIDGANVAIENNIFFNCSRNDMPGAIDFEPDNFSYHTISNISVVGNYFKNIGGNVGTISVVIPMSQNELKIPVQNVVIIKNYMEQVANGIAFFQRNEANANEVNQKIIIKENIVFKTDGYPLALYGAGDVTIEKNVFQFFSTNVFLGLVDHQYQCYNILFENNFLKSNTKDGVGVSLRSVDRFYSKHNIFEDIGLQNGKFGIAILGEVKGKTSNIISTGDVVFGDKTTAFSIINPGHKTDTSSNLFQNTGKGYRNIFPSKIEN